MSVVVNGASGGGGSMGKRFDVYELPRSQKYGDPLLWEAESGPIFGNIGPQCTVDNETYTVTDSEILVYNHITKLVSRYNHSFTPLDTWVQARWRMAAIKFDGCVWFFGGFRGAGRCFTISISTKLISSIQMTGNMYVDPVVCTTNNGELFLTCGNIYYNASSVNSNRDWANETDVPTNIMPVFKRTSANGSWTTVGYIPYQSTTRVRGFSRAVAKVVGEILYMYVTTDNVTNYPNNWARYKINIITGNIVRDELAGAANSAVSQPFVVEFDGEEFVISDTIKVFDFVTNTVDTSVYLPSPPIVKPYGTSVVDDALIQLHTSGFSQLQFPPEEIPENIGGVLVLYKDNKFRAEKTIVIDNRDVPVTITPEWQTATTDIEIKKGEYSLTAPEKVYVKTK